MVKKIKKLVNKIKLKRTTILMLFFCVLFLILLNRLFSLQIIHGKEYAENFNLSITKERTLKGTRGNILDRNGRPLAYNKLSYNIMLEDNGTYDTTRQRNLTLNHVAYEILKLLDKYNEKLDIAFHIVLDENGNYAFDAVDFTLNRFKADVYGQAYIEKLKKEELNASPDKMMEDMCNEKRFALFNNEKPYTKEELAQYDLPENFTKEETLGIIKIRYALSANSFKKFIPVTISTDVSEDTMAEVMERKSELQGIDIAEGSRRVYEEAEAFAPLIGYTGKADAEELKALKEQGFTYPADAIIGKSGIEKEMETTLQGKDGSEKVFVDNMGKVLQIDEKKRKEPTSGNDVVLSIDSDLQVACYKILEQKIAGILVSNITNEKEFEYKEGMDTARIKTPIYDVYHALINNNILDINHFKREDATPLEQKLYKLFLRKQKTVFENIREELTKENPAVYKNLSKEMQSYQSYVVNEFLMNRTGILSLDAIDATDPTYIAWTRDSSISLKEYLTYAAGKNWIDISEFSDNEEYLDSTEMYSAMADYLTESLADDKGFSKIIYKYMLLSDTISGQQLCMLLYDQGVLAEDTDTYNKLASGSLKAYTFMLDKIRKLEITLAQLALDPCSGSVVITDVKTGEALAVVTYPGYDNNRLANNMDTSYYAKLMEDRSRPFYNKATQQRTAPGSTFKIVTVVSGIEEGIIDEEYKVVCRGVFNKVDTPVNCWLHSGHGTMTASTAITNSCNVFMNETAYELGLEENGKYSDSLALGKLQKYANMFRLNEKSGLEVTEEEPQVSDKGAIQTSIGQGTNNFTTSQLARYVTTIASQGTSYELSLFDKIIDSDGKVLEDFTPVVEGDMDISDTTWDTIHKGMRGVAAHNALLAGLKVAAAGKTGTAQQDYTRPSHGLFIGFAPYDDPEIAMAVRIANGYSSSNAVAVAKDILRYKYNLADEADIITGTADTSDTGSARTD